MSIMIEKSNRPFRKLNMILIGSLNLNTIAENMLSKGSKFSSGLDRCNNVTNISLLTTEIRIPVKTHFRRYM